MRKIFLLTVVSILILNSCKDASYESVKSKKINYSHAPASDWRDALISGNGEMGIMVYGAPGDERIIFNHEFLFEFLGTEDIEPADISEVMPRVKQLIKEEKYHEAKELTLQKAFEEGHPDILWTDPYHPACALSIKQDFTGQVTDYKRTTTYTNGEIVVDWKANEIEYSRRSFVSRPDSVIAIKISASSPNSINVILDIDHQINLNELLKKDWNEGFQKNIEKLHPEKVENLSTPLIEPAIKETLENWQTFRVKYQVYDRGYEVIMQVRNDGGSVQVKEGKITVGQANDVQVFAQIMPIEPFTNSSIEESKKKISTLGAYDELRNKHELVHGEMFNRVKLNLDKTGYLDGSNEELISAQKESDRINPYLLEKLFDMGIYGLISSSGQNPPNLMGLWNGEWRPRWSGDFTTDANVNLQISAANLANLPEAINSYMTMLERIAPDWEVNAKNLHGCRGYVAGTRTSGRRNLHTHFGNWPGHYWTAGAEWLLLPCFEYYQCTGDEDFLLKRLLPMMKKTALFYEDFLDTYDENGMYLFAPSYSPENKVGNIDPPIGAVSNATMDIAVVRELLTNLIHVSEKYSLNEDRVGLWKEMLTKLPPYLINKDGALKEWAHPHLEDNYNHRHVSHLYPVWPGLEITPEDPGLYDAAKVAMVKRGRGNGSAHGLAHTALIGTRLKQADLVYGNLLFLLKNNYLYTSLFTSHNPGIIYNSDALHSIPAVIMEMLVYSQPGVIEFLPACSEEFSKGSIEGVLCRTLAKVELLEWDFSEKRLTAVITSKKDQKLLIQHRRGIRKANMNGEEVQIQRDDNESIELFFAKNETKTIVLEW